jgi:hypothetical protein
MSGLAAAASSVVVLQRRIPVASEETQRILPAPVTGEAQPGDRRCSLPAGAKQASLSSPPRLLAAVPAAAFRSQAVGAFGEAGVMVWVRRFRSLGHGAKLRERLYPIIAIIGNKNIAQRISVM